MPDLGAVTVPPLRGTYFRAIDPAFRDHVIAGSRVAGRYSRADEPTLYLSSSVAGVEAAMVAHAGSRPELGIVGIDVEAAGIVDLHDPVALRTAGIDLADAMAPWQEVAAAGGTPRSWAVRDRLLAIGATGLVDPSRTGPGLRHLVLFRWNEPGAPTVRPLSDGWRTDLLVQISGALPGADIEAYGSVTVPGSSDGWSDLDVAVRVRRRFDVEEALGGRLWAHRSTDDGDAQVVRVVLVDGRRVDLTIRGARGDLPAPPPDNDVRFDAALAAVRLGRGSDLIGLHLVMGVLREGLVHRMVAADEATGTTHHRSATHVDADAGSAAEVLHRPLGPRTALEAYALHGAWRSAIDPSFAADPVALQRVIERGLAGNGSG